MSKKTSHTPGPWSGSKECINDSRGRLLATVYFTGVSGDISVDEGHANSRLMTFAPEMLKALEHAEWEVTECACTCSEGADALGGYHKTDCQGLKYAKRYGDLIAKVRGKSK